VTDDVREALDHIQHYAVERFRLRPRPLTPADWLGEPPPLEVAVDVLSSDVRFGSGVVRS
jgi:hypothetical protein